MKEGFAMKTKRFGILLVGLCLLPASLAAQPRNRHISLRYQFSDCPVLQTSNETAWAAGVAMMVGWKENTCSDIHSVLQRAGGPYLSFYNGNQAPSCDELFELYRILGLKTIKAFNPAIEGWRTILAGGPVLTTLANYGDQGHVVFLNRLYEDTEQGRAALGYFNPPGGRQESLEVENFLYNYGTTAAYCSVHFAYWPDESQNEMFELFLGSEHTIAAPVNFGVESPN
jgi:hypothetical protein